MIETFKKLFGPQAENYSKYREPYPNELFTLLLEKLPKEGKMILDVGCGTGKSTEPLLTTGLKVIGCDHDSLMIDEAKKQADMKNLYIDYIVSEAEHLPFGDESFDVVTVGTAFHFFVSDVAMSEIKRVLKPGGLLFVYWTLTVKKTPEENEIPASIFQKYDWVRVPSELRDLSYISEFLSKAELKEVSTKRIPIAFDTTVEERVGLQTTSGFYELLTPENKESFLNEVREVLTKKLGDRTHFRIEEEIQVCWGFKS